jgi:hypothetical protein
LLKDSGISHELVRQFDILKIDALLCLRMAMKHNEKQIDMYSEFIHNGKRIFPYQHLMSEIIPNVIERKSDIIGHNHQSITGEELEDHIMKFLHLRESEIFISCDWNFNLPAGHDVLSNLLKMSNDSYNFQPLLTVVNQLALDYIFLTLPSVGHQPAFQIVGQSQSMIYCFMLNAVCTTL